MEQQAFDQVGPPANRSVGAAVQDLGSTSSRPFAVRTDFFPVLRLPGSSVLEGEPSSTSSGPMKRPLSWKVPAGGIAAGVEADPSVLRAGLRPELRSTGLSNQEAVLVVPDLPWLRVRTMQPIERATFDERAIERYQALFARREQRSPSVDIDDDARTWAEHADAFGDATTASKLCLQIVPRAKAVHVTLTHDQEDGVIGLHVCVSTSATPEDVVAAEDQLHEALFSAVRPSKLALFSIGYDFQR